MANWDSVPFNVFERIDSTTDEAKKYILLERMGYILIPEASSADGASLYFNKGGRSILIGALIKYYFEGYDFCDICTIIMKSDINTLLFDIDSGENEKAKSFITEFQGVKESDKSGCFEQVKQAVKVFFNDKNEETRHNNTNVLVHTFRRPRSHEKYFSPQMLEKYNTFIVIPDDLRDIYQVALRLLTTLCLDYFSTRKLSSKSNILFLLDEYSSLGKIDLRDALAKYRKRKVRVMILTQSLPDLDLIYGETARDVLLANFGIKIILNSSTPNAQKYFSDLIGRVKRAKYSHSKSDNTTTYTTSEEYEYEIHPEYFGRLKSSFILIRDGYGYTEIRKKAHYKKTFGEYMKDTFFFYIRQHI